MQLSESRTLYVASRLRETSANVANTLSSAYATTLCRPAEDTLESAPAPNEGDQREGLSTPAMFGLTNTESSTSPQRALGIGLGRKKASAIAIDVQHLEPFAGGQNHRESSSQLVSSPRCWVWSSYFLCRCFFTSVVTASDSLIAFSTHFSGSSVGAISLRSNSSSSLRLCTSVIGASAR